MSWTTGTLGDIASKAGGFVQTGPFGSQLHEHEYQPEGVPVIMPKDIMDGRVDATSVARIAEATASRLQRHRLQPRTIVLPRRGAITKRAFIREDQEGWLCGTGCLQIVLGDSPLQPEFLYYYMEQAEASRWLEQHAVGTTMLNLSATAVAEFPVAFPLPQRQREIVGILSAYDDLIENNRRRMVLLEDAARQLYQEWFVRLRFPGREHTRFVDGVPQGWRRTTIQEFVAEGTVQLQTGPFGTQLKASDYVEDGTPVVNVRNIGMGTIRVDKLEYVDEITVGRLSAHVLRQGDIVFARKGAVERHVLVDVSQDGWLQGSDCIRLRSTSQVVPALLLSFALREPAHQEWILTQCSNKATMPSLNQDVIGRIPILLSPHALVEQFRLFAAPITEQIGTLARLSAKLRTARDLLLPRLMRGELLP